MRFEDFLDKNEGLAGSLDFHEKINELNFHLKKILKKDKIQIKKHG